MGRSTDAAADHGCLLGACVAYSDSITRTLRRYGVQEQDLLDLRQDTYLQAVKSWAYYDRNRDLGAWLRGIARNVARDAWRSPSLILRLDAEPNDFSGGFNDDPGDKIDQERRRGLLVEALHALSREQRELLAQKELEGTTYAELAIVWGLSVDTVESRLKSARKALQVEVRRLSRRNRPRWVTEDPRG